MLKYAQIVLMIVGVTLPAGILVYKKVSGVGFNPLPYVTKALEDAEPCHMPARSDVPYTPQGCHDNIYSLAEKVQRMHPNELQHCHVVFILNKNNKVRLWKQQQRKKNDGYITWDYHVIMVYKNGRSRWVYDWDSVLPWPTSFDRYKTEVIRPEPTSCLSSLKRYFRVVPASVYLVYFLSKGRIADTIVTQRQGYVRGAEYTSLDNVATEDPNKLGVVHDYDSFMKLFS